MATDKHEHAKPEEQDDDGLELNAHEPTEEEAKLAAELELEAEEKAEDEADEATDGDADDEQAEPKQEADAQAESDPAPEQPKPAEAQAADPTPVLTQAAPAAPKDFDAEFAALRKRYDNGDVDEEGLSTETRALAKEEAAWQAKVAIHEDRVEQAKLHANQAFATASAAFESDNADFLKNPIRRQAMQQAINQLDQDTGGKLSPSELIKQAAAVAFEAFNYEPPAKEQADDKIRKATDARRPDKPPRTLRNAPQAAELETSANSTFRDLDQQDISDLEDAMAHMTPSQQEAYLRDAPGAQATGR